MAASKLLRPPLSWSSGTKMVVEEPNVKRWSPLQVREMKNGTYDWSKHEERRV